MGPRRGH